MNEAKSFTEQQWMGFNYGLGHSAMVVIHTTGTTMTVTPLPPAKASYPALHSQQAAHARATRLLGPKQGRWK